VRSSAVDGKSGAHTCKAMYAPPARVHGRHRRGASRLWRVVALAISAPSK
jgi:hypothetical protein